MRLTFIIGLTILVTATSADARHRHRGYHDEYPTGYSEQDEGSATRESSARRRGPGLAQILPRDWRLQPPEPNWTGKRFTSPDGLAWFALYTTPTDQELVSAHIKSVAFAEGETIAYLRGGKDWVAVSGLKGDRIFYRKAIIACAGRSWHQIAFEYPANMKQTMDAFVSGAAVAVQNSEEDGCDKELWSGTVLQNEKPH